MLEAFAWLSDGRKKLSICLSNYEENTFVNFDQTAWSLMNVL